MNRVGGSAAERGGFVIEECPEPRRAAHAATRNCEATQARRRVECAPKTEKGTERKRKEDTVVPANTGRAIDPGPTLDHPVPALRGIQPPHRLARGAAGLMEAAVFLDGEG